MPKRGTVEEPRFARGREGGTAVVRTSVGGTHIGLVIGYGWVDNLRCEYTYDAWGRVTRQSVMRDDALNGSHWDFYFHEAASGRLQSVLDVWSGEVNEFVWNPEGTLARWEAPRVDYARVFSYDEEGRLTKIERDYGNGNLQTAYEYGYNGDGVKVLERRYLTAQHRLEFRFIGCGAGCAGNSLSLYAREHINGQNTAWRRAEEYVNAPTAQAYSVPTGVGYPTVSFVMYPMTNGYVVHYADGQMMLPHYTDSSGVPVGGYALPACAEKRDWEAGCVPSSSACRDSAVSGLDLPYLNAAGTGGLPQFGLTTSQYYLPAAFIGGILWYLVRACLQGIGGSVLGNLVEWITCVLGALMRGYPLKEAIAACGGMPVNGCELLGGCIGGILGGPLGKWIPKLRDIAEELVGWMTSGFCRGLMLPPPPKPCPTPRASPRPRSLPGGGGWPRLGPLPAV